MNDKRKSTRKHLTLEQRHEVAVLYGKTSQPISKIANQYGIKKSTVSVIGRQAGYSRKEKYSEEDVALILRGKELGFAKVAQMITDNGHPTDERTVQSLYYIYIKKS